ncbi:hypothetical protein K4B79_22585 [Streptomyces lincolnensis]|uniref:hypothetical protein n=1 Tax=Streptomyces lincolnensis TaxID=1915 RepID=UPI001E417736|nr:hypothetical protein [Streptomyces lincolnensis]MCD7441000.1 hypothetical protein [Streptomyces lincolnensis]
MASLVAMRRHPGALADLIEQAATASAGPAVLVLDGAEGVLEGNEDLCAEAVEVALAARITPVLVSRDDAADALRALASRLSASEVTDFCVPPLDDEEISTVVGKAPALATLARDPRSRWLLRRLVVVDLLLRSVEQGGEMPPALASEADVYIHVWLALVQNNGRQVRGVMPDDRSGALMSLAEARLTGRRGQALSGPVVGALRSDGLLAPLGAASAVSSDEHAFAHDVLRDFAITRRLLLHDGLEMLDRHGPRCAVRAARIACQVTLRPSAEGSFADRWDETYAQFQHLASLHGPRWEEVPWEALLSAGWCGEALEVLTGRLLREPGLLTALLKCVLLRFVQGGRGDALVLAPVVAWLVQQRTPLLDRAQDESADEIVLQWLRAVAEAEICSLDITEHRGLRVRLRDALLQAAPQYPSDGFVEALALLGTDRGDEVGVLLRELASERPQRLMHAVDRLDAARCLATTDAPLLAELALAYYRPRPSRPRHGASRSYREGGQHEFRDIREQTRAAWYRGPFYVLLSASPQQGTRLINRLLDAQMKSDVVSEGEEARDGLLCIDFPGLETRDYLGDLNSWDWYRGGLNGPQPSMSALMALERFLDDLIQTDTVTVQQAAKAVLQNVGTPAGAGLAYGLLVRHIEQVKDELDGFLACPAVWELELQRVTTGQVFNRLGNRSSDDFRAQPPQRVAMSLVVAAGQRNDQSALKRLQDVGRRLREAPSPGLDVLAVGYWADHLDWERYSVAREGREAVVEVQPSVDIAEGLGQRQAASQLAHTRYELLNRYAHGRRLPHRPLAAENFDQERLLTDIAAARALAESEVDAWDGVCAVAAASLHAVAQGFRVPPDDLEWSLSLLTSIALEQPAEGSPDSHSVFPWGVHRLAALALPSALTSTAGLGSFQLDSATYSRVRSAVIASAGSLVHEVRAFVVEGLRPVWSAACNRGDRPCHHEVAWDSVQAGLQVVLARANAYLCGHGSSRPPVSSLEQLVGEEGSLHALGTLAPAVLEAARTRHCLTTDARALRTPLLKAYARVACAWSDIDHHRIGEQQSAMAAALLRTAVDDPEMVHSLGEELVQSPAAFSHVLYGLKLTATYEPELIEPLGAVWPHLMELVLTQPVRRDPDPRDNDCADEESWAAREQHDESFRTYAQEQLMGELVPQPTLSMGDADMDSTLRRARARWLQLEPFEELIETWTAHKPQSRFAADHLIDFLKTQPVTKQLDPGLRWLRQLVVAPSGEAESHGFALADWLRNLHPFLTKATRVHYQSLVDGLALSGHPQAAALQQLDE